MQEQLKVIRDWLGQGSINIFGMPFAGKDTQGQALADLMGADLLGGGAILRNSVIPDNVRDIMNAGELIPTEDYMNIVIPYLGGEQFAGKPLILSSVGRWDGEQEGVLQATHTAGHPIKAVVLLTVSEATAHTRHQAAIENDERGRADDADAHILTTRLEEYRTKTVPVIEFYRQQGLLLEISGEDRPAEVTENILHALFDRASGI